MHPIRKNARIAELRAIIEAYHAMTIDEAESADAGDREIEAVAELWRLEQAATESVPPPKAPRRHAA